MAIVSMYNQVAITTEEAAAKTQSFLETKGKYTFFADEK